MMNSNKDYNSVEYGPVFYQRKKGFYEKYVKRTLDILISLTTLILFSWLLLIIALLVKFELGSPVIFKQPRPGLIDSKTGKEKIFDMYKFRSMTSETDSVGNLLPDNKRLTKFGKALRASSLDELPELFNILKGDMSLIGPRPQLVKDMVFMTEEQRIRHTVRPGLTGYAQVNGRNVISWEQKINFDLDYISSRITFINDLKIILNTVEKVIKRSDIVREGTVSDLDFGDFLIMEGKINQKTYNSKLMKAKEF